MKRLIFTIFLLVQVTVMASAQGFLPILEEGKEWVVTHISKFPDWPVDTPDYVIRVIGQSEFDSKKCWELESCYLGMDSNSSFLSVEEDGVMSTYVSPYVWEEWHHELYPGECPWMVEVDMNLVAGNIFHGNSVKSSDYIYVRDVVRKRIKISNGVIWVEGIGTTDFPVNVFFPQPTNGVFEQFYECRKDGEVIFTYDDFFAPSYDISGVDEVAGEMPLSLQVSQGQICVKAGSQTTVCLRVFSVDGSEVAVVEGKGSVSVPTASFDPGVYVARAVGGGETRTLKWVQ